MSLAEKATELACVSEPGSLSLQIVTLFYTLCPGGLGAAVPSPPPSPGSSSGLSGPEWATPGEAAGSPWLCELLKWPPQGLHGMEPFRDACIFARGRGGMGLAF